MVSRVVFAVSIASLMALGSIVPVLADEPTTQSNEMDNWKGPQEPVGPGQTAIAGTKRALAAGKAVTTSDGQAVQAAGAGDLTVAALTETLVGTWEREQQLSYACGPTAVQVEADWAWNMGPDKVKYTQATISTRWTHTTTAGTDATHELAGANGVLVGSPRASFPYWLGNPTSGSDWYSKLHTDLILGMPQIVNLTPWWQAPSGLWYFLTDWKNHKSTGGHYIVAIRSSGTSGCGTATTPSWR